MNILLNSLRIGNNDIYIDMRPDITITGGRLSDIVIHLKNNQGHISGYSLIRISNSGLLKFKRVGHNPNYRFLLELDHEEKLCIDGVDMI